MSSRTPRNLAASVRQRLMNLSRERGEDFQLILTRYGLERLLYRLSKSPHGRDFVLKGAALLQLFTGEPHRATRDLDLLGRGDSSAERMAAIFQAACSFSVEEDGLTFLTDAITTEPIKEDDQYQGVRLRIEARLEKARIPLQVDIGFGDAITPEPQRVTYPTLLDFPAPQLSAYPLETVVAEKFQAMVQLGMANSRMKDFYDIWTLARRFSFDGAALAAAIQATFERRRTALPTEPPLALTSGFAADRSKATQWKAFISRGRLIESPPPLTEVVSFLNAFLMPPALALAANQPWSRTWTEAEWR